METYDGNAGLMAGIGIVGTIIYILFYLFFAYCLKLIAEKTGRTENSWWAWIPILNMLLLLQIAQKPMWWFILMLIPLVNIVIAIVVLMEVAKARGKEGWWGIIAALIPIVGIPYLAFSDDGAAI